MVMQKKVCLQYNIFIGTNILQTKCSHNISYLRSLSMKASNISEEIHINKTL